MRPAAGTRPPPSDAAARYQKARRKDINNFGPEALSPLARGLRGEVAEQWESKHYSLKSFHHQNQPDHDVSQSDHDRKQKHKERAEHGNNEQKESPPFEGDRE